MPICRKCQEDVPRRNFTTSQLKKKVDDRECRECLHSENIESSSVDNTLNPVLIEFKKSEEKAYSVLLEKKNNIQKEIDQLSSQYNEISLREKLKIKDVPSINETAYRKAVQDEEKRKHRAKIREEEYVQSNRNFEILSLKLLIDKINNENANISDFNNNIYLENYKLKLKKKEIFRKIRSLEKKIEEIGFFLKEAKKNIRYLDYSINHNLEIDDMDDLIDMCNSHRNHYIAKVAYENGTGGGYSDCYQNFHECDKEMNYISYDYAECSCGNSNWCLNDIPNPKYFDILNITADGEEDGPVYFHASI